MSRYLLLMRHAKSSWEDVSLTDKERPLNGRGKRDALKMGARIARLGIRWDRVISSPAKRALDTAKRVVRFTCNDATLQIDERLYFEGAASFLEIFKESVGNVMLFSHNPDIETFFDRYCGAYLAKFPTASYALFAQEENGLRFICFDKPKNLTQEPFLTSR